MQVRLLSPRLVRWSAPALYVAALSGYMWREGVPVGRERLLLWIVLGLLAHASLGVELPRVPLLVGGNSAEVHAVAATLADAVGLIGYSPGVSTADFDRSGLERQITRLRELAGPRSAELELHVLVQWHDFTTDREAAAARAASELDVPEDVVLDSPYVLLGGPDEIAEQMDADARRFGISRWTVFGDRPDLAPAEAFVPVLNLLARG